MASALIIVDVQNSFADPEGSLYVKGGEAIAERINQYVEETGDLYDFIVATQDWHPNDANFEHFSQTPDFKDTWPPHCIAHTEGAEIHPALVLPERTDRFLKGQDKAAYSGFEGVAAAANMESVNLNEFLIYNMVVDIDVCGLATDYCVKATALDGKRFRYDVAVLIDLCAAVAPESGLEAVKEMVQAGIPVIDSEYGV